MQPDPYSRLKAFAGHEVVVLMLQVLAERREGYRDQLEKRDDAEIRGRAKECRDLFDIFT
jgi:hypothetical protein